MRKNINKLATLVMTGMLAASMSFGAFADDEVPSTISNDTASVAGATQNASTKTTNVKIKKTVTTDTANKTYAPKTSFKIQIEEGEEGTKELNYKDEEGNTKTKNYVIYKGTQDQIDKMMKNNTDTVAEVDFSDFTNIAADGIYEKYFNINIPDSAYTKVGVYSYKLTEVVPTTDAAKYAGIEYDTNEYTMYVSVVNENGGITVSNVIIIKNGDKNVKIGGVDTDDYEAPGIVNNYGKETEDPENPDNPPSGDTTHDLIIEKSVTGNTGDKTKTFHFEITVTPDEEKENFLLEDITNGKDNAVAVTTLTWNETKKKTNTYTADVVNGTKLHLTGLTEGDLVEIKEVEAGLDGYTSTYVITDDKGETIGKTSLIDDDKKIKTVSLHALEDEATLTITNDRENPTPTGVVMDVAPYALMVALASGAAATFLRKKESFED